MRTIHIKLTAEQLKYLSLAFNNELTIQQPNLFKNITFNLDSKPANQAIEAKYLANCAKVLIQELANRLLNKSNLTIQNRRKNASISFSEAEAHALILCSKFGGFEHFGAYERGIFYLLQDKANQLAISD